MTDFRLPWPDKRLSPNSRTDRRRTTDVRNEAKTAAWAITKEAGATTESGTHLTMTFRPPDRKRRDLDNAFASMKYPIDGVALAMGVDDVVFSFSIAWGDPTPGGAVDVTISKPEIPMVSVPILGRVS